MPVDPVLKKPKGIAYIDYDTTEAAALAIAQVSECGANPEFPHNFPIPLKRMLNPTYYYS